ncbi:hypothetical protein [Treponema putidum]|uniref:Uncharacterized protein n=1 Tax=Treponema putidum TaxID=221027 RepID=A0ABY5HUR7_9SPIR|nr:hypothetical protein [Treponema putidum]UTY29121.1 hypothetical protein E4N76_09135 [Treponema putidum]
MDTMEKFYSDASRLVERFSKDGDTAGFDSRLTEIFCKAVSLYDKQAQVLANDFADYWLSAYSAGRQKKEDAIEWFYQIFSLIAGNFKDDMDFPQEDWEQINLIISSEAETLDMNLLNSIMTVIVERKKI